MWPEEGELTVDPGKFIGEGRRLKQWLTDKYLLVRLGNELDMVSKRKELSPRFLAYMKGGVIY